MNEFLKPPPTTPMITGASTSGLLV
jgi:hypothetical protein